MSKNALLRRYEHWKIFSVTIFRDFDHFSNFHLEYLVQILFLEPINWDSIIIYDLEHFLLRNMGPILNFLLINLLKLFTSNSHFRISEKLRSPLSQLIKLRSSWNFGCLSYFRYLAFLIISDSDNSKLFINKTVDTLFKTCHVIRFYFQPP